MTDTTRDAFEAWYCKAYHPHTLQSKENGCYLNFQAGMAWDAWQAATQGKRQPVASAHDKTIDSILDGIDRDEIADGWWETSDGVTFGKEKLLEIKAFFASTEQGKRQPLTDTDTETEAWLIEWGFGAERRKRVFLQNAIGDYRHLYKDATVHELVRRIPPPPTATPQGKI